MSLNDLLQAQLNNDEAFVAAHDGSTVVVTNGRQMGIAFCGKDEKFDLFKGIRVALIKMTICPADELAKALATLIANTHTPFAVVVDREELQAAAVDAAYKIGQCEARNCFLNVWRFVEETSKELPFQIHTLVGN